MKTNFLISIIPCLTFQFVYGQASITEKYYSRNYKIDDYKKANLQSTYVYDFNEKRNVWKEPMDEMSTSKPMPMLRLSESGGAYPTFNDLNEYNKNLNWKERMLINNKQSSFISDILRGMLIKGGNVYDKK